MIKTITSLKITTSHNLFDQNDTIEYLTIDYLDEDGNQKQIKNLPHEEDVGIYDVKTDSWEDILEDWRLTKPAYISSSDKGWELLESYLHNLTSTQSQELEDCQNKLYEAGKLTDILLSISCLSNIDKATFKEMLNVDSENVWDVYAKQWNRIASHRSGNGED